MEPEEKSVWLVYEMGEENALAICTNKSVAEAIAEYNEEERGNCCFVEEHFLIESIGDYL